MTPNCNNNQNSTNSKFFIQQKTTPTITPLKDTFSSELHHYQRFLQDNADCDHRSAKCVMCNGSDMLFTRNNVQRMDKGNFNWHLNSLFSSDGQRLNSELLDEAYEQYKNYVELLRQHSKIRNSATPVSVVIGKRECPHE